MFGASCFAEVPFASDATSPFAPLVIIDTHDGFAKRNKAKKAAGNRLREQIRFAIEGPQADEVREAIAPHVEPGNATVTLDLSELMEDLRAVRKIREAYEAAELAEIVNVLRVLH